MNTLMANGNLVAAAAIVLLPHEFFHHALQAERQENDLGAIHRDPLKSILGHKVLER